MTTALQTFGKNLRGKQLYPFAIGFSSVLLLSAYLFRNSEEDYLHTNNKRFAAPFVKKPAHPAEGAH